jgi:ABC-type multidrug transport system fused ATPase/permease subunit
LPLVLLSIAAALLLSVGGAFAVEMLQRVFSQDYRAMAKLACRRCVAAGHAAPDAPGRRRRWRPGPCRRWCCIWRLGRRAARLGRAAKPQAEAHRPRGRCRMNDPILSIRGLRKSFGPTEIMRGVDLDLRGAERHALIGPNGAGKSTLFHLISGHLAPSAGRSISTASDRRAARRRRSTGWAWRARSRSPTSFRSSRCSRTSASR